MFVLTHDNVGEQFMSLHTLFTEVCQIDENFLYKVLYLLEISPTKGMPLIVLTFLVVLGGSNCISLLL